MTVAPRLLGATGVALAVGVGLGVGAGVGVAVGAGVGVGVGAPPTYEISLDFGLSAPVALYAVTAKKYV